MKHPIIIQGGMGVAVSSWTLARAVSMQGHLGVVSGTGIGYVLPARMARGHRPSLEALRLFPHEETRKLIEEKYWERDDYSLPPLWNIETNVKNERLFAAAAFVEVMLAKQGHDGVVGINLLEKATWPNLPTLYGAMLAGVDYVLMGAGIPLRIPGALDAFANHGRATYPLEVEGAGRDDDFRLVHEPKEYFPGIERTGPLKRPQFLPIISSHVLGQALIKRADGSVEGFVVETAIAGGHNAPPRGKMELDEKGEPIYGPRDVCDLPKLKELGKPFWLAGGYGSAAGLKRALEEGAAGVQVGTAFAYCAESGMEDGLRRRVQRLVREEKVRVRTDPRASPTGFPFKIVNVPGTLSEADVRDARPRVCNVGILRKAYKRDDGKLGYRCASEPEEQYLKKGGDRAELAERLCLCNTLLATAGFPWTMKNGQPEPPLVTSGDDLPNIKQFFADGKDDYTAADVIRQLMSAL